MSVVRQILGDPVTKHMRSDPTRIRSHLEHVILSATGLKHLADCWAQSPRTSRFRSAF
jgi:hypothetical protein